MECLQRKNYVRNINNRRNASCRKQNCAFIKSLSNYLRLSSRSQYDRQY